MQIHNLLTYISIYFRSFFLMATTPIYGGQAVLNGVMMKGQSHYAVSVSTSKGIQTELHVFHSLTKRYKLLGLPFIRGIVGFAEMMVVGFKSLHISTNITLEDETGESVQGSTSFGLMMFGTLLFSMLLAVFLFKFLPLGAASLLDSVFTLSNWAFALVDGLVRLGIFLAYLSLLGLYADIKDLFRYHGGEHKTIACFEAQEPLTVGNIAKQTAIHRRCGTTFVFIVFAFGVLVYAFIPKSLPFFMQLGFRLLLLPLIASVSYELQRLSAKKPTNFLLNVLIYPGLLLQKLSVREPSPKHIRVAKASLLAVQKADNYY
jgi:uncharacterized protein YqhQ